jgi:hypothetical protein
MVVRAAELGQAVPLVLVQLDRVITEQLIQVTAVAVVVLVQLDQVKMAVMDRLIHFLVPLLTRAAAVVERKDSQLERVEAVVVALAAETVKLDLMVRQIQAAAVVVVVISAALEMAVMVDLV